MKLLVIEDNEALSRNMVRYFSLKDIHTEIATTWPDWLHKAATKYYDAIILDINLPEMNGIELCKKLREKGKNVPVIMLTSRSTTDDVIEWLKVWADDYLVKPFDYGELLARIESLTRRNLKNKSNTKIPAWEFVIDFEKREVRAWERSIQLSHLEFELLSYLARNANRVVSRKELYEKVWGEFDGDFMFSKTIDVYIGYLRKKLSRELIETSKWVWYMLVNKEEKTELWATPA